MTVAASIPKEVYDGNDSSTVFPFPHIFYDNADLVVIKRALSGAETTLVLNTDYTVSGVGGTSGSVTYPISGSPLATGEKLGIVRAQDLERVTDLDGSFFFDSLNLDSDKLIMMIQENREKIDRAALYDRTNTTSPPRLEDVQSTPVSDIKRTIVFRVFSSSTSVSTGDVLNFSSIDEDYNGWKVVDVSCSNFVKGATGSTDILLKKKRISDDIIVDVLSTAVTVGDERYASDGIIDTNNNTLATGDIIYPRINGVHTAPPLGATINVLIQEP